MFTLLTGFIIVLLSSYTPHKPFIEREKTYLEIAAEIESQLLAHAASSCGNRLAEAQVLRNGDIRINCTENEATSFNIFNLVKTFKTVYGISLANGNTITFNLSGGKMVTLRFTDHHIATRVYQSLINLVHAGKDEYNPDLPLDINETVDSINAMLRRMDSYQPEIKVTAKGTIIITNNQMQMFYFNVTELSSSDHRSEGLEVNGIEMVPCTYQNVAANNWINFNSGGRTIAYIKFFQEDDEEVGKLHQLFLHLRTSLVNIMHS